jgi:two-component system OmpR family sensor kinase
MPSAERIPGSGLGLSIAQKIVQAHRGELTVTSRPGETTIHMILPLESKRSQTLVPVEFSWSTMSPKSGALCA